MIYFLFLHSQHADIAHLKYDDDQRKAKRVDSRYHWTATNLLILKALFQYDSF